MVKYKKLCMRCKKKYVPIVKGQRYALCYDCQKEELKGKVKDKDMKKMFKIPEKYYKKNGFLRNTKISFLRHGKISDKKIERFRKTVKKLKDKK